MERKKNVGILPDGNHGYIVDRRYKCQRIRQRGFKTVAEAKAWMICEMEKVRVSALTRPGQIRLFEDAATRYLLDFEN